MQWVLGSAVAVLWVLFVPVEGIRGRGSEGLLLDDQPRPGHFQDLIGAGQAHFIVEPLREPERLLEADQLLGSVVGKLGAVDIQIGRASCRERV